MPDEFRIEFSITRRRDGEADFAEVGFGSSGAWQDVAGALYDVQSIVENRQWETSPGMPDPDELEERL